MMSSMTYKDALKSMQQAKQNEGEEFSEEVVKKAWERANMCCENCGKKLVWNNHEEGERGAWEAHHITPKSHGGTGDLSNCEILCLECHKHTKSYGKNNS